MTIYLLLISLASCLLSHSCILQLFWPWYPRSTKYHLSDSCIPINYLSWTGQLLEYCILFITWLLYSHQLPELYPVNFLSIVSLSINLTLVSPINYLSCTQSTTCVLSPYQLPWLLYSHKLRELYPVNYLSIVSQSITLTLVFPSITLTLVFPSTTWVVSGQLPEYRVPINYLTLASHIKYLSCTQSTTWTLYPCWFAGSSIPYKLPGSGSLCLSPWRSSTSRRWPPFLITSSTSSPSTPDRVQLPILQ